MAHCTATAPSVLGGVILAEAAPDTALAVDHPLAIEAMRLPYTIHLACPVPFRPVPVECTLQALAHACLQLFEQPRPLTFRGSFRWRHNETIRRAP